MTLIGTRQGIDRRGLCDDEPRGQPRGLPRGPRDVPAPDAEELIEEARRRQRHRWGIFLATVVMLVGGAAIGSGLAGRGPARGAANATGSGLRRARAQGVLPTGGVVKLDVAGDLAVGPSGALYVAAPAQHEILVRLANGTFAVVAGDGKSGYSGNGVPALGARLSSPYDLTFGPGGSLWFADEGRVREIGPRGIIRTVAGNGVGWKRLVGAPPAHRIASGAVARSVSLGTQPHIAFSPTGQLYLDTTSQLLRLSRRRLYPVVARQESFRALKSRTLGSGLGPIAFDVSGDLDVSGFNGWAVWRVLPDGAAHYLGYSRRSGGADTELVRGPGGAVYAENGSAIVRLGPTHPVRPITDDTIPLPGPVAYNLFHFGLGERDDAFFMASFAFGPRGVVYADEIPGGEGFEAHQQLVVVKAGRAKLLWQEPDKAPSR